MDLATAVLSRYGGIHHFNIVLFLLFFIPIFVLPCAPRKEFGDWRPD
jgi:hypothetical protein